MGGKYYNLEKDEMDYPPSDKIILKSDFDEVISNPHFAYYLLYLLKIISI